MILYILNCKSLIEDSHFYKGISLIDTKRKEQVRKIKSREEQARSLGAGLLIQYGFLNVEKSLNEQEFSTISPTIELLLEQIKTPREFEFVFGQHGKPYIKENQIYFNISHSKDYVIAAFSNSEVGVDIQSHERTLRSNFGQYILTKKEQQKLVEVGSKESILYDYFSAKEAYIKLTGKGMAQSLKEIEIDFDNHCIICDKDEKKIAKLQFYHEIDNYSIMIAHYEENLHSLIQNR